MKIEQLKREHQLIARLLRGESDLAKRILEQRNVKWVQRQYKTGKILAWRADTDGWIDRFFKEVITGNLPVLIYDRICELGLSAEFQELPLSKQASKQSNLLDALRKEVAAAAVRKGILQQRFIELLDMLEDQWSDVVFIKGTVLSQTVYERPEHRLMADFDLVVNFDAKERVIDRLQRQGFSPIWDRPGYCIQFGAGPVSSLSDLFVVPCHGWGGCHNLTLNKENWPDLELKFEPIETGLRMRERERFFEDATRLCMSNRPFLAPCASDHLMLSLVHFHKHQFRGWHWLYDIHLLAKQMSQTPSLWDEFIRRSKLEGILPSAYKGLCLAEGLLGTSISSEGFIEVLAEIRDELPPAYLNPLNDRLLHLVNTEFIWNSTSLPMLVLNAFFLGGLKNKWLILFNTFYPSDHFLSCYYAHRRQITWWNRFIYLPMHWLVLILPGGIIRRTFGLIAWRSYTQGNCGNNL